MKQTLILAILFVCTILWTHPSAAQALAVGIPADVHGQGYVYGYAFGDDGEKQALDICRGVNLPCRKTHHKRRSSVRSLEISPINALQSPLMCQTSQPAHTVLAGPSLQIRAQRKAKL